MLNWRNSLKQHWFRRTVSLITAGSLLAYTINPARATIVSDNPEAFNSYFAGASADLALAALALDPKFQGPPSDVTFSTSATTAGWTSLMTGQFISGIPVDFAIVGNFYPATEQWAWSLNGTVGDGAFRGGGLASYDAANNALSWEYNLGAEDPWWLAFLALLSSPVVVAAAVGALIAGTAAIVVALINRRPPTAPVPAPSPVIPPTSPTYPPPTGPTQSKTVIKQNVVIEPGAIDISSLFPLIPPEEPLVLTTLPCTTVASIDCTGQAHVSPPAIPEPGTLALLLSSLSLFGIWFAWRRRRWSANRDLELNFIPPLGSRVTALQPVREPISDVIARP